MLEVHCPDVPSQVAGAAEALSAVRARVPLRGAVVHAPPVIEQGPRGDKSPVAVGAGVRAPSLVQEAVVAEGLAGGEDAGADRAGGGR